MTKSLQLKKIAQNLRSVLKPPTGLRVAAIGVYGVALSRPIYQYDSFGQGGRAVSGRHRRWGGDYADFAHPRGTAGILKQSLRRLLSLRSVLASFILAMACVGASVAQLTKAQEEYKKGEQFHRGEGVGQDSEMALRFYKRALDIDPDLFHAFFNSGLIYYEQEKYKHAIGFFIKAVKAARKAESGENEALARSNLGACYHKEGNLNKAQKQAPSPRYQKFKGKIKSGGSKGIWESTEVSVIIVGLLAGLFLYWFYMKVKAR